MNAPEMGVMSSFEAVVVVLGSGWGVWAALSLTSDLSESASGRRVDSSPTVGRPGAPIV